mmetsp:Transcript_59475/g.141391  ORF Transcript_59475/g.141391 Transcript_59475/m.141391 type:complete len:206 (-) Transcript_59475:2515-3132(-)
MTGAKAGNSFSVSGVPHPSSFRRFWPVVSVTSPCCFPRAAPFDVNTPPPSTDGILLSPALAGSTEGTLRMPAGLVSGEGSVELTPCIIAEVDMNIPPALGVMDSDDNRLPAGTSSGFSPIPLLDLKLIEFNPCPARPRRIDRTLLRGACELGAPKMLERTLPTRFLEGASSRLSLSLGELEGRDEMRILILETLCSISVAFFCPI